MKKLDTISFIYALPVVNMHFGGNFRDTDFL